MARALPLALQAPKFRQLFETSNPGYTHDQIDIDAVLDRKSTYGENLEALQNAYPAYSWEAGETPTAKGYETMILDGLQQEAEEFNATIIKDHKLDKLQGAARSLKKHKKLLDECRGLKPHKPKKRKPKKICPPKDKIKVTYLRCP